MINNMIKSKEGFKYMSDTLNNSSQIKLEWNKPKITCLGNLKDLVQMPMGTKSIPAPDANCLANTQFRESNGD